MQNNNKKIIGLVFKCIIRALFGYQCLITAEERQMQPALLLLPGKGLIFYKVLNTQQGGSSRSFAFSCFSLLCLQQVPCDKAQQLNDSSPGGASFLLPRIHHYLSFSLFVWLHFPCDFCPFSAGKCNLQAR